MSCKVLDTQKCIYTAQGTIFCQSEPNPKDPPHFDNKVQFSYGMPFYQANMLPMVEGFVEEKKKPEYAPAFFS
jgi:hypothetical protein